MTATVPMIHFGINPADTGAHIKRKGADYNDQLAHDHYGSLYMFGISNAEYRHLVNPANSTQRSFSLVPQRAQTDTQHLRALGRAAQISLTDAMSTSNASTQPFLLLVPIDN